ncbi:MAG: divergent PAP2 family protein [Oscillospiraceae bacterium]|nr:divergent PAP2 family protein [Oscillospiraceae bacterium]
MNWFFELISNPYFVIGLTSWAMAQVLKVIINACLTKQWSIERLFGDGGMPSGHSATVASVATVTALINGFGSFEFAISALLAIIVCHDAMGVRLETGKQAVVINEIVKTFETLYKDQLPEVKLKEFVGHSPVQVGAGILLGILNALWMYFTMYA